MKPLKSIRNALSQKGKDKLWVKIAETVVEVVKIVVTNQKPKGPKR